MTQETADLVSRFGRQNVLEFASLLLDLTLAVHGEAVGERALGQAMAPDDAASALATSRSEFHDQGSIAG